MNVIKAHFPNNTEESSSKSSHIELKYAYAIAYDPIISQEEIKEYRSAGQNPDLTMSSSIKEDLNR